MTVCPRLASPWSSPADGYHFLLIMLLNLRVRVHEYSRQEEVKAAVPDKQYIIFDSNSASSA